MGMKRIPFPSFRLPVTCPLTEQKLKDVDVQGRGRTGKSFALFVQEEE